MSSNQDLSSWWKAGAQKNPPGRKPTNSLPITTNEIKVEDQDTETNNPVADILQDSFGHHSFESDKIKPKQYSRKNMGWGKMKVKEDKNKVVRDRKKEEIKLGHQAEIENFLEVLGNPLDDLDIITVKKITIHTYFKLWDMVPKQDLEEVVAKTCGVSESSVYRWVADFKRDYTIEESRRGKNPKISSPMDNEEFRNWFIQYVRSNASVKGQANMTCKSLATEVNKVLQLSDDDGYSEKTIYQWLHNLNFSVMVERKQLYYDGHEVTMTKLRLNTCIYYIFSVLML